MIIQFWHVISHHIKCTHIFNKYVHNKYNMLHAMNILGLFITNFDRLAQNPMQQSLSFDFFTLFFGIF